MYNSSHQYILFKIPYGNKTKNGRLLLHLMSNSSKIPYGNKTPSRN